MKKSTVAIVGAGPYGLSASAHLSAASGMEVRVFGPSMSFWQYQMPKKMLLRSGWRASYIADPNHEFTLERYQAELGRRIPVPVPLEDFVSYGSWFQKKAVPYSDPRRVKTIAKAGSTFSVQLEDGNSLVADRVFVAAGIAPFANYPQSFDGLPHTLVSHTSEHRDFSQFSGRKVAIVGAGQSALESAALLTEAGAQVEVFVREQTVYFLGWRKRISRVHPLYKMLYSWTDVGPAGLSQLVSRPNLFRQLPRALQTPLAARSIRPAGAGWLRPRLNGTNIRVNTIVQKVRYSGDRLTLELNDNTERTVDHLLLATGFRVDISRYPFFPSDLLQQIRTANGYPVLSAGFESSVPGLHFLGAPAAWSFGPLMRFVAGTEFTGQQLLARFGRI